MKFEIFLLIAFVQDTGHLYLINVFHFLDVISWIKRLIIHIFVSNISTKIFSINSQMTMEQELDELQKLERREELEKLEIREGPEGLY